MRLFEIITNCVVAVLLVFSITFNVLTFCGYGFVKEQEKTKASAVNANCSENSEKDNPIKEPVINVPNEPSVSIDGDENEKSEADGGILVYWDDNIKVTFLQSAEKEYGPVHKFNIENTSKKTLTVMFTQVYINGKEVFVSGLTCEHLLPAASEIADFVLMKKDWEHFTDRPSKISFKIKLVNDKSHLDLYESKRITMEF